MTYDAILVLGGGIKPDGQLPQSAKARVRRGVKLLRATRQAKLIFSGRWSFTKLVAPPRTEAIAMQEYAISLGVSPQRIILEEDSLDTIGNAYFTKVNILEPNKWHKVAVVSTTSHLPRVEYIFTKVFGPSYRFDYLGTSSLLSRSRSAIRVATEQTSLVFTKQLLDEVEPGDSDAVKAALDRLPGYGQAPKYDRKKLYRAVTKIRRKL